MQMTTPVPFDVFSSELLPGETVQWTGSPNAAVILHKEDWGMIPFGAASSLLADGATPAVVQRQLRHSDARITLGIYGHVIGDEQRDAVQTRSKRLVN
jgi:hypothetical protein